MEVGMKRQAKIRAMKKAYDRFLGLASELFASKPHAADLLEMNSAYNRYVATLTAGAKVRK
jgi:hypothetical protein